jgi:hypothetical protein
VSELWLPPGLSVDDLVERIHRQIARFAEEAGVPNTVVELELRDGSRFVLDTLSPEPGQGFVTVRPHPEEAGEREELIVPLATITRIRISKPEDPETPFGFALPEL